MVARGQPMFVCTSDVVSTHPLCRWIINIREYWQHRRARRTLRYVEPLSEARTPHGKRRVSARQGRAGEKAIFFSILLGMNKWSSRINEAAKKPI